MPRSCFASVSVPRLPGMTEKYVPILVGRAVRRPERYRRESVFRLAPEAAG